MLAQAQRLPSLRQVARASATSGLVMSVGDVICQRVSASPRQHSKPHIEWERTARFGAIGAALHGPYFLLGFRLLDQVFGPATGLATVVAKTLAGQVTMFPLWLAVFFPTMGLLEGRGLDGGLRKLRANFVSTFATGSIFWPIVNVANFRFVPTTHRVLYVNACGLVWNTFLSWLNARGEGAPIFPAQPVQAGTARGSQQQRG